MISGQPKQQAARERVLGCSRSVPLSRLHAGSRAILLRSQLAAGDQAYLGALGLVERCELEVVKHGQPSIVRVRSTRIGITSSLADRLLVEAC